MNITSSRPLKSQSKNEKLPKKEAPKVKKPVVQVKKQQSLQNPGTFKSKALKKNLSVKSVDSSKKSNSEKNAQISSPRSQLSSYAKVMSNSDYLRTISDPFTFRGVRIPDLTLYPSATFSITDRRQITTDTSGQSGIMYGTAGYTGSVPEGALVPVLFSSPLSSWGVGQYYIGNPTVVPSFNTDVLTRGTSPNYNWREFAFVNWSSSSNGVPSLFSQVRLVSAVVTVDYTGTDFDNAGVYTAVFVPRVSTIKDNMNSDIANPLSLFQQLPDSIVVPVNKNAGVTVRYRPQDFVSLNYADLQQTYSNTGEWAEPAASLGGEIYVLITGATSGKAFQVTSVFNYEGLPLENSLDLFSTKTSKSDPLELSATFNALEEVVPVSMGTEDALGVGNEYGSMPGELGGIEHNVQSSQPLSKTIMLGRKNGRTTLVNEGSSDDPGLMESLMSLVGGKGSAPGKLLGLAEDVTPLLMEVLTELI
jgi:hypothetical protein